jgi:FG-GAP repeat
MWKALLIPVIGAATIWCSEETRPLARKEEKRLASRTSYQFAPPVRLEAAGKPIDTAVGHAAPLVVDFDGDGKNDLLVGQFGEGILWFYKNMGTNAKPRYAAGVKFKEGKKDGRVPTG